MVEPALIDSVSAFAVLSPAVREALAEACDEVVMPANEQIARQGDFAYELFAIIEGTARIEQDGEVIAILGQGELCGEIGLLLTGRRTAAIVSETPVRLLVLFDQALRRLERQHPEFAEVIRTQSRNRFTRPATV